MRISVITKWMLGAVALLSGCISSPKTTSYILYPDSVSSKQYNALVTVYQVVLPEYLDKKSIVKRTSRHAIGSLAGQQWTQNFRNMLRNSLATDLLVRSNGDKSAPRFNVTIEIKRFELDANNRLDVLAECHLGRITSQLSELDPQTFSFSSVYAWDGRDMEALITLFDKAISEMSELIIGSAVGVHFNTESKGQ